MSHLNFDKIITEKSTEHILHVGLHKLQEMVWGPNFGQTFDLEYTKNFDIKAKT